MVLTAGMALGGIILVVWVARRYNLVAAGALITAWASLVSVVVAQLVAAWLAAERAQVEALQEYLKEMGALLSKNPGVRDQASADKHDLRILARAHTLTVLSGLKPARQELVINYLREVNLLDALELNHPDVETQDELLQAYFNQMSSLGQEENLWASGKMSEVRTLARARTLTVLGRLDPSHKTAVVKFLAENGLILGVNRASVVESADYLRGTNLSGTDLSGTDLRGYNLSGTNLSRANLREADLRMADLSGANLRDVDLRGANLYDARGITTEGLQRQAAYLKGATMPNGKRY